MARLLLLLGTLVVAAAGCAGSPDWRDMVGTTVERRDVNANRARDEELCIQAAREEVEGGSPACGQAHRQDTSFAAREARRCAAFRCMQAKGYSLYEHEARTRGRW